MSFPVDIETLTMYAAVIDQHDEVLDVWHNLGIQDALVLHIDAHSDMTDGNDVDLFNGIVEDVYSGIGSFLCEGVYEGVIDRLYWLNPHHINSRHKLQYLGARDDPDNLLSSHVISPINDDYDVGKLYWTEDKMFSDSFLEASVDRLRNDIRNYNDNFVLDIDLDAFCADTNPVYGKVVHNINDRVYDGDEGWERRVYDTIEMLASLECDPRLITIARSTHGMREGDSWVPVDKVDKVQSYLLGKLHDLYRESRVLELVR